MSIDLKEPGFSEAEVHEERRGSSGGMPNALKPAVQRLQNAYSAAHGASSDALHTVERYVSASPLKALGVTLAVSIALGVLLGALLRETSPDEGEGDQ